MRYRSPGINNLENGIMNDDVPASPHDARPNNILLGTIDYTVQSRGPYAQFLLCLRVHGRQSQAVALRTDTTNRPPVLGRFPRTLRRCPLRKIRRLRTTTNHRPRSTNALTRETANGPFPRPSRSRPKCTRRSCGRAMRTHRMEDSRVISVTSRRGSDLPSLEVQHGTRRFGAGIATTGCDAVLPPVTAHSKVPAMFQGLSTTVGTSYRRLRVTSSILGFSTLRTKTAVSEGAEDVESYGLRWKLKGIEYEHQPLREEVTEQGFTSCGF
ncbi:hypothetical protein BJ546DRAFT_139947 [Cryomyces antarcticus]